jgi:inosose dehydratase
MLGGGDLDVDAVLDGLRGMSFGGWLVVEQDILPHSAERFARAAAEQAAQPTRQRRLTRPPARAPPFPRWPRG